MRYLDKARLCDAVSRRVKADLAAQNVSQVAIAVWQDGEEMLTAGFGGVDAHTMFRMASMTKPVTAVAVMIAVERGLLSLDDPIEQYLPEFADRRVAVRDAEGVVIGDEPAHRKITPRLLLSHSSGLVYADPHGRFNAMTEEDRRTLENGVAVCAELVLAFQPGESQSYSNTIAWDPLLLILERLTGMDYLTFITKEIFQPCGMVDTTYLPTDEQYDRMATMHNLVDGKGVEVPVKRGFYEGYPNTHYLGCAGLYSTLSDYVKFALMLQNGGEYNGHRILSAASVAEMATPQLSIEANPGAEPWGLSMRVIRGEEYPYLPAGTFGWSGAYGTHFWVDPVNRITAVYLKNSKYSDEAGIQTARHFEEDVYTSLV